MGNIYYIESIHIGAYIQRCLWFSPVEGNKLHIKAVTVTIGLNDPSPVRSGIIEASAEQGDDRYALSISPKRFSLISEKNIRSSPPEGNKRHKMRTLFPIYGNEKYNRQFFPPSEELFQHQIVKSYGHFSQKNPRKCLFPFKGNIYFRKQYIDIRFMRIVIIIH